MVMGIYKQFQIDYYTFVHKLLSAFVLFSKSDKRYIKIDNTTRRTKKT